MKVSAIQKTDMASFSHIVPESMCPKETKTLGNAKSPPYCKVLACFLLERSKVLVAAKGRLKEMCSSLSSQVNRVWLVGRSGIDFSLFSREHCHSYMDKSRGIKTELNGPG